MKITQNQQKQKGFTIIEVVLVLAIAGLIFLIVFLAVPALQRSQRDTQRRNDVGRFMSQIAQYQSNSNGEVPEEDRVEEDFVDKYLVVADDTFADPSTGVRYEIVEGGSIPAGGLDPEQILYNTNSKCDGGGINDAGGNLRTVSAVIGLEGGGSFCQDNV